MGCSAGRLTLSGGLCSEEFSGASEAGDGP